MTVCSEQRPYVLQREERSPQVWSAVLGCLMHLVSHCGYIVRGYVEGLSMKVVAALMQCCLEQRWCHMVYCQLTRIAANMMYVAAPSADVQGQPQASASRNWIILKAKFNHT